MKVSLFTFASRENELIAAIIIDLGQDRSRGHAAAVPPSSHRRASASAFADAHESAVVRAQRGPDSACQHERTIIKALRSACELSFGPVDCRITPAITLDRRKRRRRATPNAQYTFACFATPKLYVVSSANARFWRVFASLSRLRLSQSWLGQSPKRCACVAGWNVCTTCSKDVTRVAELGGDDLDDCLGVARLYFCALRNVETSPRPDCEPQSARPKIAAGRGARCSMGHKQTSPLEA
jgi:hypothetical protein